MAKLKGRLSGIVGGVNYNVLGRFRDGSDNYRQGFLEEFQQGLEEGSLLPSQFSIRRLFESLVPNGREVIDSWDPRNQGSSRVMLTESGTGVSSADFANISGQIIYAEILAAWENPAMLHPMLMNDVQTQFNGEKIAGIGNLGDVAQVIAEGKPYPTAGVSEEWIETPQTTKRGFIVPVTKEAAFFDRTGELLSRCREITQSLLVNKEKRCLDAALGITDLYRRNGGTAQATYGTSHTNGDFSNLKTTNGLVDWTNIEAAELLFDAITDPNTGEPIMIDRTSMAIVVPTALRYTANRIQSATSVDYGMDNGGGSAANTLRSISPSPLDKTYPVLSNAYVKARTGSATTWFIGDFKGAFEYRQNWPITPVTAPGSNHDELHYDIIQITKISERGTPAVREPRKVVKCT